MGLFDRKKEGGLMDVIRCDEPEYLIWKWRPKGQEANTTKKENAIRYGSSLRVKDGEVAVFVYKQKDGSMQDFIEGPYDDTIKTANFPILTGIVGTAFGGASPFQAEIYYINLSGIVQVKFAIPYFDVFDPRFLDFAVPMAVRGTITFNIADYKSFIKLHRLINFELDAFQKQIKDAVVKYVKGVVTNIPLDNGIPVMQMERKILEINDIVAAYLKLRLENDFGVNMKSLDIAHIEPDKESEGYISLMRVTKQQTTQTIEAQTDVNIKNMYDSQRINAENMQETLRIQREEAQRAQRLQSENTFIGAHAINKQAEVLTAAANNLGQMGTINLGGGDGAMNPAGMMMGMAMGGAMGSQMGGMMNQMGRQMMPQQPQQQTTPPPMPGVANVSYMISINGQQYGPYNMQQLQQLVQNGQMNNQTYVWKQGMANWELAGNVAELVSLFGAGMMAPPPPMPPMP